MKSSNALAFSILALAICLAVGCSDDSDNGDDMPGVPGAGMPGLPGAGMGGMGGDPMTGPTFTMIFNDVLLNSCGGPVCHTGGLGNLTIAEQQATYDALVNVPAMAMNVLGEANPTSCVDTGMTRVVPGDPDSSLLYAKIRLDMDAPCGNRMPTGGMLPQDQIDMIRDWIAAGAPNN